MKCGRRLSERRSILVQFVCFPGGMVNGIDALVAQHTVGCYLLPFLFDVEHCESKSKREWDSFTFRGRIWWRIQHERPRPQPSMIFNDCIQEPNVSLLIKKRWLRGCIVHRPQLLQVQCVFFLILYCNRWLMLLFSLSPHPSWQAFVLFLLHNYQIWDLSTLFNLTNWRPIRSQHWSSRYRYLPHVYYSF